MHVHTLGMSSDSELPPGELSRVARRSGLTGINLAEHDKVWPRERQAAYPPEEGLFLNFGMEVSTDLGHLLAIGLPEYVGGIRRAERLREEIDRVGGCLIVAHPFRYVFESSSGRPKQPLLTVEEAAELPVFRLVDAVEVANACNTARENDFALQVAQYLGLPTTGGSDAHSTSGVGHYATGFAEPIRDQRDFLEQLRAGRFEAVHRASDGSLLRFQGGSVEEA